MAQRHIPDAAAKCLSLRANLLDSVMMTPVDESPAFGPKTRRVGPRLAKTQVDERGNKAEDCAYNHHREHSIVIPEKWGEGLTNET